MCFPLNLKRTSYVARKPPKGGSKMQNRHFPSKIALHSKKVCYKVSLCEYCQQRRSMAFTGLSNRAKMVGVGRPRLHQILAKTDRRPFKNADFQSMFPRKCLSRNTY